jgi:hypothetical protein
MKPIAQDNERFKLLSADGPAAMPDGHMVPIDHRSTLEMMHDRDRTTREEAIKNAIAITAMEGGVPLTYCSLRYSLPARSRRERWPIASLRTQVANLMPR